ncbi:glycosyltransferase [uncultured Mycobacterium sp.]|uniref:glycosyltransferase n=1 Tax=uncultured Mycobacterium sp. TaxID=171292 RepID=UPI0035CBFC62
MRLLQVAGTLNPAYGGPCVVVNQLTRTLTDLGHSVDVVTLDPASAPWLNELPGPPRGFGPALGKYGYSRHLSRWLERHAPDYDAVTVHGIWQYQSRAVHAACTKARVPYFLFIHGALDPWFRERYPGKHAKKTLYWRFFEHRTLRDAQAVLYTCEEERRLARTSFTPYRAREAVVGLGIEEPPGDPALQCEAFLSANPHLRDKRILLFLGRLHPKKGCDLLIEAFSHLCHRDESLHLVVAGPDESETEAGLRLLADSLQVADRITWIGMLNEDAKWGAYRAADAFVLPSHSENFGIVIAEALACGLPVLISDKVNIWCEIERCGAGLIEGDTADGATSLLGRWMNLSDSDRAEMRRRARACFLDNFEARGAAMGFVKSIAATIGKAGAA